MIGIAHSITPEETKIAAAWYAMQIPAAGRSRDSALIESGKSVYMNGLPALGVPACQSCHGPEAQGKARAPRLAGQNGSYMLSQLAKFRAGDRQHAPEMTVVTKNLDSDSEEARAVAAYLQSR